MACTTKEVSQHCEPLYPCRARERVRHRHRHSSSSIPASSCRPPPPRGSRPATHSTQHTAHSEGHREKRQAVLSGGKIIRPTHHAGQVPQEGRAEPAAAAFAFAFAFAFTIAYASSSHGPVRPEETRRGDANPTQPNSTHSPRFVFVFVLSPPVSVSVSVSVSACASACRARSAAHTLSMLSALLTGPMHT